MHDYQFVLLLWCLSASSSSPPRRCFFSFFSFVAVVVVVVVVVKMAFGVTDGPLVCYHQVEVVYMN